LALKSDFQDTMQSFIYSNLPILMNPSNAMNVIVSNDIIPTTPISPTSTTSTIDTNPVIIISPEIVKALQSYTLNNFPDIGLPQDIQQIATDFFANLPPLIPVSPTIAVTITAATTVTS